MPNTNDKFRQSLTSGLAKGWSGFVWMLKILLPISLLTSLLAWSNWINSLDFLLEPVMGVVGLPPMAAIPLIAGLLTGIYGGIAAMASLTLTVDQMTLLAIFLLISHNLIQEGVIQSKSGLPFIKATLVRLVASIFTVIVVSSFHRHQSFHYRRSRGVSISGNRPFLVIGAQTRRCHHCRSTFYYYKKVDIPSMFFQVFVMAKKINRIFNF